MKTRNEILPLGLRGFWVIILFCGLSSLVVPQISTAIEVQGPFVSGTWGLEDSPYRVMNTVMVLLGDTLIIEPGVEILFVNNCDFQVQGLLLAVGTFEAPILFAHDSGSSWRGLQFLRESNRNSIVSNCIIRDAWNGIAFDASSPTITYNQISAQYIGISCNNSSSPSIRENHIIVNANNTDQPFGIWLRNQSNARIEKNRIEVSGGYNADIVGIWVEISQPQIIENWIEAISSSVAYGVFASGVMDLDVRFNIIRVQAPHAMTGFFATNATGIRLINNDIHLINSSSGAWGIDIDAGSNVQITNNIVIGNGGSIGILSANDVIHIDSGHNDFWLHAARYAGDWEGINTDIAEDPLFDSLAWNSSDWEDYALSWINEELHSPCIDTGNPGLTDRTDNTRSDMGAVPFNHNSVSVDLDSDPAATPSAFSLVSVYPNPFNQAVRISVELEQAGFNSFQIFDLRGRHITDLWSGVLPRGKHDFNWHPVSITAGEYLVQFKTQTQSQVRKIVYIP